MSTFPIPPVNLSSPISSGASIGPVIVPRPGDNFGDLSTKFASLINARSGSVQPSFSSVDRNVQAAGFGLTPLILIAGGVFAAWALSR